MKKIVFSLLLLAFLPLQLCAKTDIYVVAVGVNRYQGMLNASLRYCKQDALEFVGVMRRYTTHITSLCDEQATRRNVYNAIRNQFAQADADDMVIFFYSGHGSQSGFCCYDYVNTETGLSFKDMQVLFKGCKARNKVVYADSCYSGKLRTKKSRTTGANVGKNNPVMFFLSSRSNEVSQEFPKGENGLFTYFLVKGLCGSADANGDKVITAKEIYNYVHYQVIRESYGKQHPVMWGKFNNDMIVADWR